MKQKYANTQPAKQQALAANEIARERITRPIHTAADELDQWVRDYAGLLFIGLFVFWIPLPEYIWWFLFVQGFLLWRMFALQLPWLLDCPDDEPTTETDALKLVRRRRGSRKAGRGIQYGDGLIRLGNDVDRWNRVLAASMGRLVTHAKVFGTTGSGKTQWLLGLLDQVIAKGSGCIFVDGKADIVTWFLLYQICRAVGREDDLLVINYLTGGNTLFEPTKHTNTNNLFAFGSSDSLMEMLSALMGEAGGNDSMWRGRAEALGRAVLRALCELRDKTDMVLSVDVIREHITLETVEELAQAPGLSEMAKVGLQNYLNELPGWKASQDDGDGQPSQAKQMARAKASEQHGYLAMQFTSVLELLGATYQAITRTDLSEVDFRDVILNRRILYIMLPAIEKSPESLKNLGRMAVTAVRNALVVALGGEKLTGRKEILVDARPTNARTPFIVALDEYGSYCVEGFADVAAQARSLGICTLFMGQDFPSFKKGSEIEAERIEANTGISVFLKTENAATADLAIRRAGKMLAAVADNLEPYKEGSIRRKVDMRYRIQEIDRLTLRDLASQGPGEGRIIFGDEVWHVQSFYGNYKPADVAQVNTFVRLHRPKLRVADFQTSGNDPNARVADVRRPLQGKSEMRKRADALFDRHPKEVGLPDVISSGAEEMLEGLEVHPERILERMPEDMKAPSVGLPNARIDSLLENLESAAEDKVERVALYGLLGKEDEKESPHEMRGDSGKPEETAKAEGSGEPEETEVEERAAADAPSETAESVAEESDDNDFDNNDQVSLILEAAKEYIGLARQQAWDAWEDDGEPDLAALGGDVDNLSTNDPGAPEPPLPQKRTDKELMSKMKKMLEG